MTMDTTADIRQPSESPSPTPAEPWPVDFFAAGNLDLVLAVLVALGLPLTAAWLLDVTGGAAAGLALYYAVCCVAIVRWRRGTLGYHRVVRWPWLLFAASLITPALIATLNWQFLPRVDAPWLAVLLTLLIWAPLNAAMEQLAWFYVLDAWRFRWSTGALRWVGLAVGIVLLLALVALIHIFFWSRFLPTSIESAPGWSVMAQQFLYYPLVASYWLLYHRSRSMWPTFVIHLLVDAQLVIIARYSLLPFL